MEYFTVLLLLLLFVVVLFWTLLRAVLLFKKNFILNKSNVVLGWSQEEQENYRLAQAFQLNFPPDCNSPELSFEQQNLIVEKGVHAWSLLNVDQLNAIVVDQFEIQYYGGHNTVQTNLPVPKQNQIYYFEVKLFEKPNDTQVGVGLATKPYPYWRLPGLNKRSIGYHTDSGKRYYNSPFDCCDYGVPCYEGDVIGCGYRPRTGSVFFTRNGIKFNEVSCDFKTSMNYFPTIGANGPCKLQLNCGQLGFVFIEANVGKWGFGPIEGDVYAPPAYGYLRDSVLLASSSRKIETSSVNTQNNDSQPLHTLVRLPTYDMLDSNNTESLL